MFNGFFMRRARERRERRGRLAERLMQLIQAKGVLLVDESLSVHLEAGRRELMREVYRLALREQVYMMSEEDGRVVLMSAMEYHRFMLRRSFTDQMPAHSEYDRTPSSAVLGHVSAADAADGSDPAAESARVVNVIDPYNDDIPGDDMVLLPDEMVIPFPERDDGDIRFFQKTARRFQAGSPVPDDDIEWFTVANGREKMPDGRQGLPERRREPWPVGEEIVAEIE